MSVAAILLLSVNSVGLASDDSPNICISKFAQGVISRTGIILSLYIQTGRFLEHAVDSCWEIGHMSRDCKQKTDWSRVECSNCKEK